MKKKKSARSCSREVNRLNNRLPLIAEIVKESFLEDVSEYFTENIGDLVYSDVDTYINYSYPNGNSLYLDQNTLRVKAAVRIYRSWKEKNIELDKYLEEYTSGEIIDYLFSMSFAQAIVRDETKFNLSLLYNHCEEFVLGALKKRSNVKDIIGLFGLDLDLNVHFNSFDSKGEALNYKFPKNLNGLTIRREGSRFEDGKFLYVQNIHVEVKIVQREDSGLRKDGYLSIDFPIIKVIQTAKRQAK